MTISTDVFSVKTFFSHTEVSVWRDKNGSDSAGSNRLSYQVDEVKLIVYIES